jgi:SEC-C motif-containing protein
MRSRYSAYVLRLDEYLRATWHPRTRPSTPLFDSEPAPKWIGLEVKSATTTGEASATVEFIARCRIGGRAERMHEVSRFVREDGRWLYIDGTQYE